MTDRPVIAIGLGALVFAALAFVPYMVDGYGMSLAIAIANYTILATAWALFSGPTRYISLATVAFFGVGAYTVAVLGEVLPWPVVMLVAAVNGCLLALLVGLSTLRLAGIYFVIFTFGLTELIRQVVTWYEVKVTSTVGRYVFLDIDQQAIYWQLLGVAALLFLSGYLIGRSRLGFALRIIGGDEMVACYVGIDTTRAKLLLFVLSALFMTLTGAIMAPRWTYIDPAIAFNPQVSFQTVIMALLGGVQRLWGPLLGVIPLTLLFDWLNAHFPNHYLLILGIVFMLIVYLLPQGVAGALARLRGLRSRKERASAAMKEARQ
ncbi:branched-chain amino acid ABC transporter permease [Pseudaminobacter salicylatoxidans]|uniref:branched-chain amino acid ABC transporter permease n=1 Tax=Pseudaminobacter salicylatoxidans TaxID=93369 RepID=UPI000308A6D1|nr:branched-chain amino acid ABC transporter permease [Pseudaminobacter salicylatoxidans]